MRKVTKCNGQQVSGDKARTWYAVVERTGLDNWHVAVYHPRDVAEVDPPIASCACLSERECHEFLVEEKWVAGFPQIEYLPADYAVSR